MMVSALTKLALELNTRDMTEADVLLIERLGKEMRVMVESCSSSKKKHKSITRMPDVVVMRVVDMLGTPPPQPESKMLPATFLADVTSMAQVCHQWNRIVRSSTVWKATCEWRFPWVGSEESQLVLCQNPKQHEAWFQSCMQIGRCSVRRLDSWCSWYQMMIEAYVEKSDLSSKSRLTSIMGRLCLRDCEKDDGDDDDDENENTFVMEALEPYKTNFQHGLCKDDEINLYVSVNLKDIRSGRMASFYDGVNSFVYIEDEYDDETYEFSPSKHGRSPGREWGITIAPVVSFNDDHSCWLSITTPEWMATDHFRQIVENLEWV